MKRNFIKKCCATRVLLEHIELWNVGNVSHGIPLPKQKPWNPPCFIFDVKTLSDTDTFWYRSILIQIHFDTDTNKFSKNFAIKEEVQRRRKLDKLNKYIKFTNNSKNLAQVEPSHCMYWWLGNARSLINILFYKLVWNNHIVSRSDGRWLQHIFTNWGHIFSWPFLQNFIKKSANKGGLK